MKQRVEPHYKIAGFSALFFIVTFTLIAFLALGLSPASKFNIANILNDAYLINIIKFTILQAALSTLLGVGLALPTALALARRTQFWGRDLVLKLFALPLALPPLVGVLAILGLWGNAGWINKLSGENFAFSIYGLNGILIAHVFFNLPLATRLILSHLEQVPSENWRLAAQLGLPQFTVFKLIEWPAVKTILPGIAALVFMLCLTSFTIVLTLGGGPSATTLEVAIYQSLRFDFDPARAITMAIIQLGIIAIFLGISFKFTRQLPQNFTLSKSPQRPKVLGKALRNFDAMVIVFASASIILPLLTILTDGITSDLFKLLTTHAVWRAILTSLVLAIASALLALILCWVMLKSIHVATNKYAQLINVTSNAILVMPAIVLGAGWFLLLHNFGMVFSVTPLLVIIINAFMALPFIYRVLSPALAQTTAQHQKLSLSLGLSGWAMFTKIDLPTMKKPLALAFAFAMALSLGDLGVVALFGSQDFTTLPLLLFKSLGSYRTHDAQGLALILAVLCLGTLYTAERYAQSNGDETRPPKC